MGETGASNEFVFVSTDNPVQHVLRNIKKSSKSRQDEKTLIPAFAYFLTASAKNLFLQGRLDTRLCPHAVLRFS